MDRSLLMFSLGICWSGLTEKRAGLAAQDFQMNSQGVRSLSVLSLAELVGRDEVREMLEELVVAFGIEAPDACVLNGSVHSLDLTVCPRMLCLVVR
jgi:hypothetical protein